MTPIPAPPSFPSIYGFPVLQIRNKWRCRKRVSDGVFALNVLSCNVNALSIWIHPFLSGPDRYAAGVSGFGHSKSKKKHTYFIRVRSGASEGSTCIHTIDSNRASLKAPKSSLGVYSPPRQGACSETTIPLLSDFQRPF